MRVTKPAHPTLLGPVPGQIYAGLALAKILRRQEHAGQDAPSGATWACASIEIRLSQSGFLGGQAHATGWTDHSRQQTTHAGWRLDFRSD